ncbi:hypothetical protein B5E77_05070 [Lachnoclostridium sp. An131]|uniref:helix-turn-helix domain-containing protein n=1 Tax=Lachnoclostridium sp. An131 TaxID=1965555 RepID=UPI000B375270|nr:helix-turn-helix transcriptional regulator [Lachnoclostridium sp. An131]OUQ27731.1 hypothetical protein B5E77_05070 [Lachnoclostridium sp. An131]
MGEGKRLQEYLKNKNIKIAQLSRDSGISQNTLYATIKRDSSISAETLSKLAKALDMETSELSDIITNAPDKNTATFKPRILDNELKQTLLDTRDLINKLNRLTQEYEGALGKRTQLTAIISDSKKRISDLQMRIQECESELAVIDADIANRQLELKMLREKLTE